MATAEREQIDGARTQSVFREVNERIEQITGDHRVLEAEILCECAAAGCTASITLTLDEYEAVRRILTHFLVAPDHTVPDIERVVRQNERYVVVEKFGEGARAAVRLDPRRRSGDLSYARY